MRLRVHAAGDLDKDSDLMIDRTRAIDNQRLIKGPLLQVDKEFLEQVYVAVQEVMGVI